MSQIKTTLYALNKNGSHQQWKVFAEGDQVIVEFGRVGGKIQQKVTTCEPKNIGKANETSGEDQAIAEAVSKWEKQVRLGYRESILELENEENLSVMLAHDAIDHSNKIIYPCYVQPKLDGLRCMVTFDKQGNPVFNSRGNKTYPIQGKIVEQLKDLKEQVNLTNKVKVDMFDGEVYLHGLSLQKISSLAKKWRTHADIEKEIQKDFDNEIKRRDKALKTGETAYKNFKGHLVSVDTYPEKDVNRYSGYESADLEYHIFDIPSKDKVWYIPTPEGESIWPDCRLRDLTYVSGFGEKLSHIQFVFGEFLENEDQVKSAIGKYMIAGYEGDMVRNFKGKYEFSDRSYDLLKWKIFKSAEALVLSSRRDKNNEGVLSCVTKEGIMFECKMKGTHEERSQEAMLKIVNNFITFTYQAHTDDGVPQFPIGQHLRDVNPVTWEVLE